VPSAGDTLETLEASVQRRFLAEKRVLSFVEYIDEFLAHPWRHSRDASRYLRDCLDHFGTSEVERPWGRVQRWKLFDQAFLDDADGAARARLVGHEDVQAQFYRALGNFVREGRANRLLLLHGPNGSAKSTFAACLMRALEHYSTTDEGALYRFSWVFPRGGEDRSIGFGAGSKKVAGESYAHLDAHRMGAVLGSELREHPLLLLPIPERRALVREAYAKDSVSEGAPDWIWNGKLGRKNAAVFDALLAAEGGELRKVLAHVQVERYAISRRYRTGAVTIGPQMAVDASERQITADRTLGELPAALTSLNLFETAGELADGQGGLVEYSDLLKRPLEAWKYLLLAIEAGEVALTMSLLTLNSVLLASTNEIHLDAFRQHPEYNSFRARIQLLRVGYVVDYKREQEIYDAQIVPQVRQHVTPHATEVAALWAVLTRLRQSRSEHFEDGALGKVAADLSPMEKARLYAEGRVPRRLESDQAQLLRAGIEAVAREHESRSPYEGGGGASPREIRTLLFDAAQHPLHRCLSPLGVLDQIQILCSQADYEFLKEKPDDGYHDHRGFVSQVHDVWLAAFDGEVRASMGLVEESRYEELFERYVAHVSLWVKGERYRDPHTGEYADPDAALMKRVETILDVDEAKEFRRDLISAVAAHAIDHPGEKVDYTRVFPRYVEAVREAYFTEHRGQIAQRVHDMLAVLDGNGTNLEADARSRADASVSRLQNAHGYCPLCARSCLGELLLQRYAKG
jgi:predicted Ser/Thr protein kinase